MAFVLQKFPIRLNYTWKEMVLYTIIVEIVLSTCFLVAASSLIWNHYAGAVGILTGLAYLSFCGISYYGIMVKPNRTFYGAILGASCVLVFVALQSAIFFGQYSNCTLSTPRRRITTITNTQEHVSLLLQPQLQQENNDPRFDDRIRIDSTGSVDNHKMWMMTSQDQIRHLSTASSSSYSAECFNRMGMRFACLFSVFMFITYLFFILVLFRFKDDILGSKPLDEGYLSVPTNEHTIGTMSSSQYPVVSSNGGGLSSVSMSEDL